MKKTVLGSILALAVSVALLAGATFAWFTDSIVNSGNKITAGRLEIEAYAYDYDANATGEGYKIAGVNGGNTIKFSATGRDLRTQKVIQEEKWEPGKSSAKLLQVANGGSLAADVKLEFTTSGDLTDALWFDFIQVGGDKITGTFTKRPMNKLAELAENLEFQLKATEKVEYIFVYGMYEDAGNDYQGKSFTVDVAILAKQAAVEEDGFGNNDYDANAEYPVASNADLEQALENATAGDTVLVSKGNYTLPQGVSIAAGVTIAGEGIDETSITVPTTQSGSTTMGLVLEQGVTIANATIVPSVGITNGNYAGVIVVKEGGTVLDNIKITSNNSASPILVTGSSFGEGDTLTISNSTISSNARSLYIVDGTNGKVIIDNCDITGIYTFNVNSSNSQNLEIEVKNSALHGWTSYGSIKSASFTNVEFSQGSSAYNFLRPYTDTVWTDCTFGEGFLIGAGAEGLNYTFTNCKYSDGGKVTAENIKIERKLLDWSGDDEKVMKCVIIVDEVKVAW